MKDPVLSDCSKREASNYIRQERVCLKPTAYSERQLLRTISQDLFRNSHFTVTPLKLVEKQNVFIGFLQLRLFIFSSAAFAFRYFDFQNRQKHKHTIGLPQELDFHGRVVFLDNVVLIGNAKISHFDMLHAYTVCCSHLSYINTIPSRFRSKK